MSRRLEAIHLLRAAAVPSAVVELILAVLPNQPIFGCTLLLYLLDLFYFPVPLPG